MLAHFRLDSEFHLNTWCMCWFDFNLRLKLTQFLWIEIFHAIYSFHMWYHFVGFRYKLASNTQNEFTYHQLIMLLSYWVCTYFNRISTPFGKLNQTKNRLMEKNEQKDNKPQLSRFFRFISTLCMFFIFIYHISFYLLDILN